MPNAGRSPAVAAAAAGFLAATAAPPPGLTAMRCSSRTTRGGGATLAMPSSRRRTRLVARGAALQTYACEAYARNGRGVGYSRGLAPRGRVRSQMATLGRATLHALSWGALRGARCFVCTVDYATELTAEGSRMWDGGGGAWFRSETGRGATGGAHRVNSSAPAARSPPCRRPHLGVWRVFCMVEERAARGRPVICYLLLCCAAGT